MTTRRSLAALAAVVLILIAGIAFLYAVRSQLPPTTVSSTPTATASASLATPTALASPSPTAAAGDRFGYVQVTSERIVVRRERDAAPLFELVGSGVVVSLDGKRIAYWRRTASGDPSDLRVLEPANPAGERSVLALSSERVGGGLVWSNDGQGLLVETHSLARTPGIESCPVESLLVVLDLTATPPAIRAAGPAGCAVRPVAWDRQAQIAAAISIGPGGYSTEYITWNGNPGTPLTRMPVPNEPGAARDRTLLLGESVQASDDAKLIMGVESGRSVVRIWPILDITKAEPVRLASAITSYPIWRPGATSPYEVIWAGGQKVEVFQYRTSNSTTLLTGTDSVGLSAVRPDGSAILVSTQTTGGPPPTPQRLVLVDIATRQPTEVTINTSFSFQFVSRGVLLR